MYNDGNEGEYKNYGGTFHLEKYSKTANGQKYLGVGEDTVLYLISYYSSFRTATCSKNIRDDNIQKNI